MTLVTRPLPGLFGGVSQQIPAMRHPTQCSVQDNGLATLVDGLYKRPGTERVATLPLTGDLGCSVMGSGGVAYTHTIDKDTAGRYELVLVNGNLMLYDQATGAAQTVLAPYGRSYLTTSDPERDFRCVTVADYTFIVNRSKTVAMKANTATANPTNVAYINVKAAVVKVSYQVTVDGQFVTHTTGDSANNGGIASALRAALAAALPTYTVTVIPGTNVIRVARPSGTIDCVVSDTWNNQALQFISGGVDKFSDLPPRFETGYVLQINGTPDSPDDVYYVKWNGQRYEETLKPGLQYALEPTTMPHQLRPDGSGGWVFEPITTWGDRKVGDEDTNPAPSFVGRGIQGVFFFRNRLGFLSGDSLVMSRAGTYFNFWASSATQIIATDPIDLSSPVENVETLDWAVPFNQSLLVWATNKQQFVLAGGDILTPESARLVPTTSFEADNKVRPVSLGNRILFASQVGQSCQVNLYRVSEDTVTNMADDVTSHVPSYVPAGPRMIVASTAQRMAVVVPLGPSKVLPVFKWEMDGEGLSQRAWCRFIFETPDAVRVMSAHWVSRTLYLLLHITNSSDPVAGGRFVIEKLNVDTQAVDQGADIALRLDSRVLATVGPFDGTNTRLDVPYIAGGQLIFLKVVPGQEPQVLPVVSAQVDASTLRTQSFVAGNQTGATIWAGTPYTFRYVFSEPVERDQQGNPIMEAAVKLVRYVVRYVKTGWFKAKVTPPLRGTYEYPFNGRTVGQPGQGPSQLSLSSGEFSIPVQCKAPGVEVVIESDSHLPVTLPYASWKGDVTYKARP